jgi:VWFA-related protein
VGVSRLLPLAVALTLLASSSATPQKPPVFGASADLVVIDLIATDGDGRVVTDLRAEEIEVLDGGKRQRVELTRFVTVGDQAPKGSAVPEAASPEAAAAPPAGREEPSPPLSLVVVVDLVTMPSDALLRTRETIVSMARTGLEPGTRLMLVALERGLRVAQPFTDDVERFVAAVGTLTPTTADGEASLVELIDQVDSACEPDLPGALQNAINAGQVFIANARLSMSTALGGMAAVGRYLAPLPGRKHVVYYSAGYPMDPADTAILVIQSICQGRSSATSLGATRSDVQAALRGGSAVDSTGMLQALVDEANRAQVSVYTVDARGLMGDVPPARSRTPARFARSGAAQEAQRRAVRAPQEILRSIADDTGGTASINTNDLARGMQAAAKDARGYYLLAYGPPAGRKEGRYYPIEVKVARRGLHLRYRRGYEWLSEAKRADRAMAGALGFPGLYAEDGLALDPWVEAGKLHVAVILPTRTLSFRAEGGAHRNELAIQGLLRDEQGRPVGDRFLFTKKIDMNLPDDRYADLVSRDNVEIANEATAPKKGRYQVAVAVRHSGGRLASATAEVVVP